jgi:hypothetical protein
MNVPKSEKGYVDLNSATPEPGKSWEYIRAGSAPKYIAFKVEYVPGHDARVTAWLNPDLSLGATEINQPTNIVTRFEAAATFDEIHLIHRGGKGGGWKFSQMVGATIFEDLLTPHFWQRGWFFAVAGGGLLVLFGGAVQLFERRRARQQIQRLEQERAVATERTRIAPCKISSPRPLSHASIGPGRRHNTAPCAGRETASNRAATGYFQFRRSMKSCVIGSRPEVCKTPAECRSLFRDHLRQISGHRMIP